VVCSLLKVLLNYMFQSQNSKRGQRRSVNIVTGAFCFEGTTQLYVPQSE
jgi:hypothetical protein